MQDKGTSNLFTAKLTIKKIVLTYSFLSILLFVFLDKIIFSLSMDNTTLFIFENAKNCLIVLCSTAVIYYLLNLYMKTFLEVSQELEQRTLALSEDCQRLKKTADQFRAQKQAFLIAMPYALFHVNKQGILLDFIIPKNIDLPNKFPLNKATPGNHISAYISAAATEKSLATIQQVLATQEMQCLEYRYQEDLIIHWEARYVPYTEEEVLIFVHNNTIQQQSIDKLKQLSIHDKLTGLTNRMYFELQIERLQDALHFPVGLAVLDAKYLRLPNDSLGHTSDQALLSAVSLIKKSCTAAASISRIGSSQFVVSFKNTSPEEMQSVANALRENEAAYNKDHPAYPLSIALGLAISEKADSSIQDLFYQADFKMYCDKTSRNKEAHELFLQAILYILREHDATAHSHFVNVQQLIEKFAIACCLSVETIQELKWLATFHDIGKIGVPSNILNKQGQLLPEELLELKKHSGFGYQIACATPSLIPIADLINKHHEWWNGKGYPLGLKKEQIPLECRILTIVEAFDAMTSNHSYRAAMSVSAALAEIGKCAGTQFDPDLTEKFIELMQKEVSS